MNASRALKYVVASAFGTLLVGSAHAEDWKVTGEFGCYGIGKTYQLDKGHLYWVGEFTGTFFNDKGKGSLFDRSGVRCPAYNDVDLNNKKNRAGGYCIIADANGDQAYVSWQGEGDVANIPGTFKYTGGTGKYQSISGDNNTFVGHIEVNWQDGTSSCFATWNK
jgi:hypothetical protein